MDTSLWIQLLMILICLILSGFFSSAETAMTMVNRIRIQTMAEEGSKKAKIVLKAIDDSGRMLSTILIGNNIVNMAASSLVTTFTIRLLGSIYVGAATGILTLLVLIFGEITPKTLASVHAEKIALRYSYIIYGLMTVLTPVVFMVAKLSDFIMLVLHINPDEKTDTLTENELRTLVGASQEDGVIEKEEKQMIYNVFDFGDSTAKDVMIPRIDMTFVDVNATYDELMEIFRKDRHTRFPVYEDTTDNVIGIINMKDLILPSASESFSIRSMLRPPYFTYEYKATADLLVEMRKAYVNLAIVLDEYGSTSGLVTLEDLLEEIVGEIRDEYDEDEKEDLTEILPGREYLARGAAKLDDINEALHLDLCSEEYDSIGGYIIEKLDSLPFQGQSVTLEDKTQLIVEELEGNRIQSVRIRLPEQTDSND